MEKKQHVRFIPIEDCGLQIREVEGGQDASRRVEGKPIIFGVRSRNLVPWSSYREVYEVIERGAISNDLLMRSDILFNINHSTRVTDILGRCRDGKGTLDVQLREDHVQVGCDLPKTNCANDTLELIKRGDIIGMSFAFFDDEDDSEHSVSYERLSERSADGKEIWLRHVKGITKITDVAIVTHPAYEQTSVATREMSDEIMKRIDALSDDNQDEKLREAEEQAAKETEAQAAQQAAEREYKHRKRLLQMKNL